MEFLFRSAAVTAHAHATEDEQRVLSALKILLPGGVEIRRSKLRGHHGNPIVGLEARVERRKDLRELWNHMMTKLRAGELEKLRNIVHQRIDETCHLCLRFDKQLAYGGALALTDSGDAIHLRLKISAFPAKREIAIELVEKFIGGGAGDEAEAKVHSI
ncbi:MAG: RNA-binding domain-containing protein [Candidatus Hodarchaeaceae archaeon]|nr:RNA-binding domain-containing protein [Candidatus Hodarchaeaceae archaeon]